VAGDILNYFAYPVGWIGAGLVWFTVFGMFKKGPKADDDEVLGLGYVMIIVSDIIEIFCYLTEKEYALAIETGGWLTLLLVFFMWKGPPKWKKKVKKLLSDKARQAKEKIVKKMREAGEKLPRPGWRLPLPVPA
jgi:hypothetical protein